MNLSMQMNLEATLLIDQLPERIKHAIRRDAEFEPHVAVERNGGVLRKYLRIIVKNKRLTGPTTIQTLDGEVTYKNIRHHPKVQARCMASFQKTIERRRVA